MGAQWCNDRSAIHNSSLLQPFKEVKEEEEKKETKEAPTRNETRDEWRWKEEGVEERRDTEGDKAFKPDTIGRKKKPLEYTGYVRVHINAEKIILLLNATLKYIRRMNGKFCAYLLFVLICRKFPIITTVRLA